MAPATAAVEIAAGMMVWVQLAHVTHPPGQTARTTNAAAPIAIAAPPNEAALRTEAGLTAFSRSEASATGTS